ncbi:putative dienelactone hydrolase [Xenococcus sp. PCC 7305]|uniref:alpha/beta hydrolase n=1 Tax=Xenococcus sp. PCC 7305 TaxID=102125 RepID=UPI0002AC8D3A|nr:alpha/beta hydrolase [Xenococcus sp. PCC 7305]ELS00850.1 putative dienelactone hydrolase [Xenococcus sp. PCC 7305]
MLPKLKLAKYSLLVMFATLINAVALASPTIPAEIINFNYSLLGFEVKVADLELFAKQGQITKNLNFYLKRISPQQRKKLQQFLTQSYEVDPVLVYRYLRTSVGIKLFERIGNIIQIPHDINGFYGLRASVVQAAASAEGINFIDFLKSFPTDIKLNLPELIKLVEQVSDSEKDTAKFIASIQEQTLESKAIGKNSPDFSSDGQFTVTKQTREFYDHQRDRNLVSDLYLPQGTTSKISVIVVSNGLGAKRDRFKELAHHLASYGFAVVILDHPGSDRKREKAFRNWLYQENFDATEFIDRPLDISFILDELAQTQQVEFPQRLNLKQVGIFGYSLGGTTAMSLAGAQINFEQLEQDCAQPLNLLNISILYQCRALELPRETRSLKDERIKAAFLFVPFGKSLFGEAELAKIDIPTIWQVVDKDFLTSLLDEQIPAFNALTNRDRYLVISEKLPHANTTASKEQSSSQAETSRITKNYQNILSLVFFESYVAENADYPSYLSSEYIQSISQEPYNLHMLYDSQINNMNTKID